LAFPIQLNNFIKKSRSSALVKDAGVLTLGTAVSQGIAIVVTPLLSRLFSPSDYGLVAMFSAVVGVVATMVTFSYPIRIMLPKADAEARHLVAVAVSSSILMGVFLLLLYLALPKLVFEYFGLATLGIWLPVAIGVGVAGALITSASYWLNRKAQYKRLAALRVIQALIATACGLLMGAMSVDMGLIYAQIVAAGLALLLFAYFGFMGLKSEDFTESFSVALKHKSAPLHLYPVALLDVLTMQLPIFLISLWFAIDMAGQYRMAYSLLALPAALIGSAVAQVFYQRFSEIWPDAMRARQFLVKTWKVLAILGFLPFTIVVLQGETIFSLVLGPSWAVAGQMASILAIMSFFSLIHSPTSTAYIVLSMERLVMLLVIPVVFFRVLALFIGHLNNNIFLGLYLFVFFEVLNFFIFQYFVFRKIQRNQGTQ
jgi:O-antigen/teichoic acid export membrane protein